MPQTIPLRAGRGPEFDLWSEWTLLAMDISYCKDRLRIWHDAVKAEQHDIAVSVFRDLVVTFTSCFDTSVQVSLDPGETYQQIEGGVEYFRWLESLRHSWVAHRHGPARQCTVGGLIDDDGNLHGPGHIAQQFAGPEIEEARQLAIAIDTAFYAAAAKLEKAQKAAVEKLEALSPHARKRMPVARTTAPNPSDHLAGRKKFQNRTHPRRSWPFAPRPA